NSESPAGKFQLVETGSNNVVFSGKLKKHGTYARWGKESYYFADFSAANKEGAFKLVVEIGGKQAKAAINIKKAELNRALSDAAKYFYYQRCGTEIPGWHGPCHTDDPQGTTGGWHDAGDYNKYIYTQWQPAWALLDLYRKTKEPKYLAEARWGEDFLAKMVRTDGSMWSAVFGGWDWVRPEQNASPRELTEAQWGNPAWAVATNSATFAKMAGQTTGAEREKFLGLAKRTNQYFRQHFNFGKIPRGEDFQGLGGIVLSDLLLNELTGDKTYLADAEKNTRLILAHQDQRGFFFSDDNKQEPFWDDYETYFFVEALGDYAKRFPTAQLTGRIKASLGNLADNHLKKLAYNTPFRQMQWLDIFDNHPRNGEVFENFHDKRIDGWIRGSNSYYLSAANAAMIAYSLLGKPEYKEIAINQLNWVLGVNPYGISFMEGHCVRCTKSYHTRLDTLPGHK
ncbi:MAG TPA: glycoside hydrolase family 9 protein, partial [Candidatus Sulfotelmatobacter sp.]|nr:glycoside hydrolase family 9 protein [Candidatus Sulfotelmatobacter sp.]